MRARLLDEDTLEISGIGFIEGAILWRLAAAADPHGSAAAEERLASSPTGGTHPELDAEWKENVLPDLRTIFASAVEIVRMDLVGSWLGPGTDASVRVPVHHVEVWLIALNQARLALAARYDLTEKAMTQRPPEDLHPRTLARLFVDFFGGLQQLLLEAGDDPAQ